MTRREEHVSSGVEVEREWKTLQHALINRLAYGLVESISATTTSGVRVEKAALGLWLTIDDDRIDVRLGSPMWDASRPPADNVMRSAEAALGLVQSELARATTEPWPARSANRAPGAHGLPQLELELAGSSLFIRFRSGPELVELKPIEFDIDIEGWQKDQEREGWGLGIDNDLIARAADSWLSSRAADRAPEEWVENLQTEWATIGSFERLWRYILRLCETVDPQKKEIIELIGVDPLVSLMIGYPDRTLDAIEDVADRQPILIEALSIVMGDTKEIDARIDAILDRCGKPRTLDPEVGFRIEIVFEKDNKTDD